MPGGDGTGPWGRGARTGRGMGYCPGSTAYGYGRRLGLGLGYGRGGSRFFPAPPVDAKELLEEERAALHNRLDYINNQLDKSEAE